MKLLPLSMTLFASIAMASSATQSDWSGGPGSLGPVTSWGECFSQAFELDWSSPGQAGILRGYQAIEHLVDGGFSNAFRLCAGDIDGDGDEDVLASSAMSSVVAWWENLDGLGSSWTKTVIESSYGGSSGVYLADIDGDGDEDVLGAASVVDAVTWWENEDGIGTIWTKRTIDSSYFGAEDVCTADIDGDGDQDVLGAAAYDYEITLWENENGIGTLWTERTIDGDFFGASAVGSEDMDADGDLDVFGAAYGPDEIAWWENVDGQGTTRTKHIVTSFLDGACRACSADIDGDGDVDLVGAGYLGDCVMWYENLDGVGGTWAAHDVAFALDEAYGLVVDDLDGDGDQDIAAAAYASGHAAWWENSDGAGISWTEHLINGALDNPCDVEAADVDGDGEREVIGTASGTGQILWWDLMIFPSSGSLESSILYTGCDPDWGTLLWSPLTPAGTSVSFQLRASDDYSQMGAWSDTLAAPCSLHGFLADNASYIQYRAILETTDPDTTPSLLDVTVTWDPLGIGGFEPSGTCLLPVTPNPSGPSPSIDFNLAEEGITEISVYDLSGRLVIEEIGPSEYQAGYHSIQLQGLGEGIYFARMQAGYFTATQRFAVVE